jgi:hypothetical protein
MLELLSLLEERLKLLDAGNRKEMSLDLATTADARKQNAKPDQRWLRPIEVRVLEQELGKLDAERVRVGWLTGASDSEPTDDSLDPVGQRTDGITQRLLLADLLLKCCNLRILDSGAVHRSRGSLTRSRHGKTVGVPSKVAPHASDGWQPLRLQRSRPPHVTHPCPDAPRGGSDRAAPAPYRSTPFRFTRAASRRTRANQAATAYTVRVPPRTAHLHPRLVGKHAGENRNYLLLSPVTITW